MDDGIVFVFASLQVDFEGCDVMVANLYEASAGTLTNYMVLIGFEVAAERTFKWSGWKLQCLKDVSSVPAFVIHLPYSEDFLLDCCCLDFECFGGVCGCSCRPVLGSWGMA